MSGPTSSRRERLLVVALLALFALNAGWALRADSSVADEHPHLLCGVLYWKSGRFSGGLDNPPLGQLFVTAPLILAGRTYEFPSDAHLGLARLPVLFSGLGLGFLLWRWGRALGGPVAGLGALAAFALEPNLLAHGHLATLDFPLTVLWWVTLWAWRAFLLEARAGQWSWRRSLTFAGLAAMTVLTKFTGFFLLPAAWLVALFATSDAAPTGSTRHAATIRAATAAIGLALLACLLLSHIAYGFEPLRFGLPETLVQGLAGKLQHRDEVRYAYLAGRHSEHGFLLYYVVAMLVKTPLPLLALAATGVWWLARRGPRLDLALLVLPAVSVVLAFTLIRVDIGVRHVLPAYPALCLLAGLGVTWLGDGARWRKALLAGLAVLWITGVARAAPQWLAYFNVLGGGPSRGHRVLLDSNLAWGQDDRRLQEFLERERGPGRADWLVDPDPMRPRAGRIVVNANALHNLQRRGERPYAWLRPLAPQRQHPGYSWLAYDLAASDYATQVERHPQDPTAAWAEAEVVRASLGAGAAEAVLQDAMRRFETPERRAELVRLAGRAALDRGDLQSAASWVRAGMDARRDDPELGLLGHELELQARASDTRGESTEPAAAARAALELGLLRGERREVREALPWLEQAARALPADPEAQRGLAVAHVQLGDWRAALAILERPDLRAALATELEVVQALAAAEAAVAAQSDDVEPELLLELGRTHFEANRYDAAAAAFMRLLALRPQDRLAVAYLGEMQVRSKSRIVEERLRPRPVWSGARRRKS